MWLLEKLRGSVENGASARGPGEPGEKPPKGPLYSNILTPDQIPDFFIPPKLATAPPEAEGAEGKAKAHLLGTSASEQNLSAARRAPPRSPRLPAKAASENRHLRAAAGRHLIQVESAEEDWRGSAEGEIGGTNADPQAQAALSLPCVPKAQTSYGFATLTESPHTRRKESLFHSEHSRLCPSSPGAAPRKAEGEPPGGRLQPSEAGLSPRNPRRPFSGGESDTCSSAESSPFGSPLLSRSVSLLKVFGQESQAKAVQLKHSVARGGSSLCTDDSSADASPGAQRRLLRRAASPPPPPEAAPERLQREHTVRLSPGGRLRLAAEYHPSKGRLRVRLVAAEELYDARCDARAIHCCVALCLNPGKAQKQRSTVIKHSRQPVFNEDFFFDGLGPADVRKMSLKLKVVNKGSSLKRDTLVGEKELPLRALVPFS